MDTGNSALPKDVSQAHQNGGTGIRSMETKTTPAKRIAFMGGNDDFRAARLRCALACEQYNELKEDAPVEDRVKRWLRIVNPNDENNSTTKSTTVVDFSSLFSGSRQNPTAGLNSDSDSKAHTSPESRPSNTPTTNVGAQDSVTREEQKHKRCANRPSIPYVKTPIHFDYGLRVRIAPTTFINRNCVILDTPVADIVIGERCSIGTGVTIISVGHPVRFEERCEFDSGKAGSWGARVVIGDGVWIGAGVTILPGVTIGSYSTIGAGSVVVKDIPPRCVATGNPAAVRYVIDDEKVPAAFAETVYTLQDALKAGRGEEE